MAAERGSAKWRSSQLGVGSVRRQSARVKPAGLLHPAGAIGCFVRLSDPPECPSPKEMVDWFNAVRAARLHYLQVAFPGAPAADLLPRVTRNFAKEGFMEKTGPKRTEAFKKRWFSMDERRLMYFKDPLDAYARGEVFIGSKDNGYSVLPGLPSGVQSSRWQFGITVATPDRIFLLMCESERERTDWLATIRTAVDRPMLPPEYAVEARFKHKP